MQTTETLSDQVQRADTALEGLTNDIAMAIRDLPGYHRIQIVLCARTHPHLVASYILRAIEPVVRASIRNLDEE